MKKILTIFILGIFLLLIGCDYTYDPNIVSYTHEEALQLAEEKYDIDEWIFTKQQIRREILFEIVEGDNANEAIEAFAGVNGNHDIQGMFSEHKCFLSYGITKNNEHKFIYYNISINKKTDLAKAIGASKYPYSCTYEDINTAIDNIDSLYVKKKLDYLKKEAYDDLHYLLDEELTFKINFSDVSYYVGLKIYKEDDQVVVDIINFDDAKKTIFYSSSKNYQYQLDEINNNNSASYFDPQIRIEGIYNDAKKIYNYYAYFYVTEKMDIDLMKVNASINVKFNYTVNGENKDYDVDWSINGINSNHIYRGNKIYYAKLLIAENVSDFTYDNLLVTTNRADGFIRYRK